MRFAARDRNYRMSMEPIACRYPAGGRGFSANSTGGRASVLIPKFASICGTLSCELRNQRDTSNFMILVPLLNPKFAIGLAALLCKLRVRGTSAACRGAAGVRIKP